MKTVHQLVLTDEYLADAQRLMIAQNKTMKLLYQTWWVWWLPRVVIVGVIIYCLLHHIESPAAVLGNAHLKWLAMLRPTIYPQGVLIKFSRLAGLWLPDQALIEGSSADVRKLLAENVKDLAATGR